jgi:crotonobetainyl-CoA:carnitine CoA-transferase CaiB-like acyl-CoA transferase
VYRCRGEDEWIAIDATSPEEVAAVASVLGPTEQGDEASAAWEKAALATALQGRGVPAFPVLTPRDLVADAHLAERGYFVRVPGGTGPVTLPGSPFHAVPAMVATDGEAPRFGEHTVAVLGELLGLESDAVEHLEQLGVLTCAPEPVAVPGGARG